MTKINWRKTKIHNAEIDMHPSFETTLNLTAQEFFYIRHKYQAPLEKIEIKPQTPLMSRKEANAILEQNSPWKQIENNPLSLSLKLIILFEFKCASDESREIDEKIISIIGDCGSNANEVVDIANVAGGIKEYLAIGWSQLRKENITPDELNSYLGVKIFKWIKRLSSKSRKPKDSIEFLISELPLKVQADFLSTSKAWVNQR